MKIICPRCSAKYEVQPDVVGQRVECQRCKFQWIAESAPTPISKLISSLKSASTSKSISKPNSIFKSASISTPDSTQESTPHSKKAPTQEMKLCPICG